jgi:CDP-paratose synthetase
MNILVTGATGFVGKELVKNLSETNLHTLLLISRDTRKCKCIFPEIACVNSNEIERVKDFDPEVVFHLASMVTSRNDTEIIEDMLHSNIIFGVKLLDILRSCKSMSLFVNFGTFAEYRFGTESINNAYLYSATKTAFRYFTEYYSNLCGYKYLHVVPYTIYGGDDSQKKIIDHIIDSFEITEPVKMTQGEQILDFIHLKDVVSFLIFLIQSFNLVHSLPNGEVLYLGTGKGISIRELAGLLEKIYNKKANILWGALPYREMDVMQAVAPVSKLIALGWKPSIQLEEGIYINYDKTTGI